MRNSSRSVYLWPSGFVQNAQDRAGAVVRLSGGKVLADRFALIVRQDGVITSRRQVRADDMAQALQRLPDFLTVEAEAQWAALQRVHAPIACGARSIRLDRPQVMGILNVTPDSFSDGGRFLGDPDAAIEYAASMLEAGAAIIDVGGESTRPGADPVGEDEEIARIVPAVKRIAATGAVVSIDTRRAGVMSAALDAGAHILNDVSALRHDPRSPELAAARGAPVVLMHAPGEGANLHAGASYGNVVLDVFDWLRDRRDAALAAGIAPGNIVLDPGIGFGKSLADNLALVNALPLFHALGHSLLVGVSRKRMIGALSNEAPAQQRLGGSLALAVKAMDAGVQLLRVHDVTETAQAVDVWCGLRDAALADAAQVAKGS